MIAFEEMTVEAPRPPDENLARVTGTGLPGLTDANKKLEIHGHTMMMLK